MSEAEESTSANANAASAASASDAQMHMQMPIPENADAAATTAAADVNPASGDTTSTTANVQVEQNDFSINASHAQPPSQKLEPQDDPIPSQSEFDALQAHLQKHPHDTEAWRRLVAEAEESGETEKIRVVYDGLLKVFPGTASAQIAYISHFLNNPATFGQGEDLFKRFLRTSSSVDLYRFYLTYIRRINTDPSTRDIIRQSYEFALNQIGQDKDSTDIWSAYIAFLDSPTNYPTTSTWEAQQKMDSLRKAYHRALQIPLEGVERLWSDYEGFEVRLNRITAKKFMAELSPAHMQARSVLRELGRYVAGLYPSSGAEGAAGAGAGGNVAADLHLPTIPTFTLSERQLVGRWKAYLKWEESNPLVIEDKDRATFVSRVQGVYKKAVIRMRYFPEIWFMAYNWTNSVGKHDEAVNILKAGIEANPASFVLNFAYAEHLELKKDYEAVHTTYTSFIELLKKDLEELQQRELASKTQGNEASSTAAGGESDIPDAFANPPAVGNDSSSSSLLNPSSGSSLSSSASPDRTEFEERRKEYALAWIMYMRFARRAEGVKSSRLLFGKARREKERLASWELYEAGALMEYHVSQDKDIATRIFEAGMAFHAQDRDFVSRYLGFLISINDDNNARALFERVVGTFTPSQARPIWERWARYEYQYGDLEASQKLEKRMAEVFPNDPPIKRFAQRHTYLGLDAIASRDIGASLVKKESASSTGSGFGFGTGGTGAGAGRDSMSGGAASGGGPGPFSSASYTASNAGGLGATGTKRPLSDHDGAPPGVGGSGGRRRDERGGGGGEHLHKRQRGASPLPRDRDRDRDRDRERWDGPRRGARGGSPGTSGSWEKERGPRGRERDGPVGVKEEEKPVTLPQALMWFVGQLPAPSAFDGPVFRTDDLMNLFRNAVIPSTTRPRSPPPPPRGGGRPPPDYSPYQGPNSNPRGRRF